MKKSEAPPERMTREEGEALIRDWRASGLTLAEFGRKRGVSAHRVRYWKCREAERTTAQNDFVVLTSEDSSAALRGANYEQNLEVLIDERTRIRLPVGLSALAEVVAALRKGEA